MKTLLMILIISVFLLSCSKTHNTHNTDNPYMVIALSKEFHPQIKAIYENGMVMYVYPRWEVKVISYYGIKTMNVFGFSHSYSTDTGFFNAISKGDTLWLKHDIRKYANQFE